MMETATSNGIATLTLSPTLVRVTPSTRLKGKAAIKDTGHGRSYTF
jgi:hypothetical protein